MLNGLNNSPLPIMQKKGGGGDRIRSAAVAARGECRVARLPEFLIRNNASNVLTFSPKFKKSPYILEMTVIINEMRSANFDDGLNVVT